MLRWRRGRITAGALLLALGGFLLVPGMGMAAGEDGGTSNHGAAYLRMGLGARALGMGGAFVAVADDVTAGYWNPAGLDWSCGMQFTGMYSAAMNLDRNYNYLGFSNKAHWGAFGLSLISAGMSDIEEWNGDNTHQGDFDYKDLALMGHLAKSYEIFSVGITGKYLRQSVGASVNDDSANGWAVDIGAGMMLTDWARFGIAVQDVASGLGSDEGTNDIPANLRAGIAFSPMPGIIGAFDVEKTRHEEDVKIHFGAEASVPLSEDIGAALRLGADDGKFAGGIGFRLNFLEIDYAYINEPQNFLDENHRISATLKFGDPCDTWGAGYGGGVRDRDGDGIADANDGCPDLAEDMDGFEDTDGCPDSDNDGDGIADIYDDCPNMAEDFDGFRDEDGCADLDNDGDGILDADDTCPGVAEVFNNFQDTDGCPDEKPIEFPRAYINFKFGTAEISHADPIPVLNDVIRIMNENPEIRVKITGHTDNIGSDEYNTALSLRRAEAVKAYLVERGIDAGRFVTEGKGESVPVDTNDTDDGRARNRRIEFEVAS
ncbi:MAG: PorV/PorQ family protein [Candidatus Eisenbacteria bacterium]|uniref:PorV/PorQ family protein n=1 Tax=Eiseniibacteriota bacterium TaxID=2212470 RepID=A0A948W7V4_UNCEI|nr:PorV/PorQ family protein [Candidatus Eisenbacteria bacterium]MBU2692994.1 PorV/PorQ family protein [Candidatus Eisenbacteria bacterium]